MKGSVSKASMEERIELSNEQHYNSGGEHNAGFDHEAFLGEDVAKSFDQLPVEESKSRLGGIFNVIDSDSDGFVTGDELGAWVTLTKKRTNTADTKHQVARNDLDKDEHVTWHEYKQVTYPLLNDYDGTSAEGDGDDEYHAESMKHDETRFKQADRDSDGKLNLEEYAAFLHPEDHYHMVDHMVRSAIADMDTDNDGEIGMDEYINHMWPVAHRVNGQKEPDWLQTERDGFTDFHDKNKDGKLDWSEVKEWILPHDYVTSEADHLLKESDSDSDGRISKEEMLENHKLFVGSQVITDFNPHDEL